MAAKEVAEVAFAVQKLADERDALKRRLKEAESTIRSVDKLLGKMEDVGWTTGSQFDELVWESHEKLLKVTRNYWKTVEK